MRVLKLSTKRGALLVTQILLLPLSPQAVGQGMHAWWLRHERYVYANAERNVIKKTELH